MLWKGQASRDTPAAYANEIPRAEPLCRTAFTPHRTDGDQRDALEIEDVVIRPVWKICGGWMIIFGNNVGVLDLPLWSTRHCVL